MISHSFIDADATCIHQRFELQAQRFPDSRAVVFEDQQLTYRQLNSRANELARRLCHHGVGPDKTVAVHVERSCDLVVALLGILKAGGAYVPLDTDYPSQRQALILEDSQPVALVTQRHLQLGPLSTATQVVYVDPDRDRPHHDDATPQSGVGPDHLAYVLYTSGTTGRPKGVAVEHRQLMSYLAAACEFYDLSQSSIFAMAQTIAVDTCITSLYSPLMLGKCLHVLSRERSLDPDALAQYCRTHRIDCLKIAPSHLAALLDSAVATDIVPKRTLILGGEAPAWELIDRACRLQPGCAIYNEYGPTETTVGVSAARLDENHAHDRISKTPPIGVPIGGCELHLLDHQLQPVADGEEGELFIGGNQLARGYFRQPAMTASAFIADPFTTTGHRRLYRTGDLARRLPGGLLEHTGRADRQTKIRGFRVEPGEIENVLLGHPAVRQVAVEPYADSSGRRRLAAYVVLQPNTMVTAPRILTFLRQRLPDAMVPSALVPLDALPRLPQGKLDRQSLPQPVTRRGVSTDTRLVPRNPTEAALREIWEHVLGVSPIGLDENFFQLGGDSLLASALIMRMRQSLGCDIPLARFFDSPTIERLALLAGDDVAAHAAGQPHPITATVRGPESPLSNSQERIWFIHHTNPDTRAYSYGVKFCFEGDLSVPILERALSEELRRHEIYRTSFHDSPSGPLQRVHPPWKIQLPVADVSDLPESERLAAAERQLDRWLNQPFTLSGPSQVRWVLIRLDQHLHWLLHVENHLVHDGWASDLFFQELFDLYNAFHRGQPSPLVDPPLQFADVARWERNWLQGPEAAQQLEYWKRTLAGCQPRLEIPTDYERPARMTYLGTRLQTELDDDLWNQLCALGRGEGATPFMVMLAVFYALLHHYTAQTDINIGTGAANRRRPEVAGVLGMFINNLVLRLDLSGNPTVRTLIARVKDIVLGAFAHQELPFNAVVEAVAQHRDLGSNPLYQAMFNFHDTPMPDLSAPGMRVTMDPSLDTGTSKFDLHVIVYPSKIRGVEFNQPATDRPTWMIWEYSTDLFDTATIRRMSERFNILLRKAADNPDAKLGELSPLTEEERYEVLVEFNDTSTSYQHDRCVHHLIEHQVERTPDAIAVSTNDQQLTYRELNVRADRLAGRLRRAGVGPDTCVGLFLERSPDLVVSILGILKAGGAYVPLDPDEPAARRTIMLQDVDLQRLVTHRRFMNRMPLSGQTIICLDDDQLATGDDVWSSEPNAVSPEHLAYVIFTSGSSGKPNAVAVPHRNVVNLFECVACDLDLGVGKRVLGVASPIFDISVAEMLLPLTVGATTIVVDQTAAKDARELSRVIVDQHPDVVEATPASWRQLLEAGWTGDKALTLISTGESLSRSLADRLLECCGELRDYYGPTETTIWSTIRHVAAGDAVGCIGRPIANTQAYVLDEYRQPVGLGIAGELYIGGAGVARGYLNRPELTAARFVQNPFDDDFGARLYRTGDRCRWRPDGTLQFMGRLDNQIKLRGHRIELGEIEEALREHPQILECAVIVRDDQAGDRRLVAYCNTAAGDPLNGAEVSRFLATKLPRHMIPSAFVPLDALPLTPSAKLDRQALTQTTLNRSRSDSAHNQESRSPIEDQLCKIWCEVMEIEDVGIHDDFFDLGGHSLLAMRLVARIEERLGAAISVRTVFEASNIAELAHRLTNQGQCDADTPL